MVEAMSASGVHGAGTGILSLLLIVAGGCEPGSTGSPRRSVGQIVVVGAGKTDPLWPVLEVAAARFARTTAEYQIRVVAPDTSSAQSQMDLIKGLDREHLLGLCVQVLDPRATLRLLEALRADGLAVVTMMRRAGSAEPFLHCGIGQWEMGAALADALAAQVPGPGTVAVLLDQSDPIMRIRHRGFAAGIARYPRLTMLRDFDCGGDPATAVRLLGEGMERFPGLDGWATMAAWPLRHQAPGRLLPPGCRLVVPGPLSDCANHILFGHCQAVIIADYQRIVTRALEMCVTVLGQQLPAIRDYSAPLRRVTRDYLSDFDADWAEWTGQEPPERESTGP